MNIADELQKLQQLHQSGAITDDEFAKAKARLFDSPVSSGSGAPVVAVDPEQQTRQWATFLHFSQLAGVVTFGVGLIVPIIIWQVKKIELPGIDVHGKIVANWILSEILYGVVCSLLICLWVGLPFLAALVILAIVFPIIGGIKANNGETWKYPLSIPFFR